MICEYCGGEVVPQESYEQWRRGECANCHVGYAFRKEKDFHEKTLREIYDKDYEAIMRAYRKHIHKLIENAKV